MPDCSGTAAESFWTIGIRKASVFPVPVCAVATTSAPVNAGGIDLAWTGVGSTKRLRARFWCRQGVSVSSENVFIEDEMCRLPADVLNESNRGLSNHRGAN